MSVIPVICPNCKSVFPFTGIHVTEGSTATFEFQGSKTTCPVCRYGNAVISDGVYQANSSAVSVLSAPQSTKDLIKALREIVEQAASGNLSQAEAIQKAADISPQYGSVVETFTRLGIPGLALLATLIGLYLQYSSSQSSSEDVKKVLDSINAQTLVLKDIHYEQRVQHQGDNIAGAKSNKKPASTKAPDKRRSKINKKRRKEIADHRRDFGGARRH
jgi:hypothetical protein